MTASAAAVRVWSEPRLGGLLLDSGGGRSEGTSPNPFPTVWWTALAILPFGPRRKPRAGPARPRFRRRERSPGAPTCCQAERCWSRLPLPSPIRLRPLVAVPLPEEADDPGPFGYLGEVLAALVDLEVPCPHVRPHVRTPIGEVASGLEYSLGDKGVSAATLIVNT